MKEDHSHIKKKLFLIKLSLARACRFSHLFRARAQTERHESAAASAACRSGEALHRKSSSGGAGIVDSRSSPRSLKASSKQPASTSPSPPSPAPRPPGQLHCSVSASTGSSSSPWSRGGGWSRPLPPPPQPLLRATLRSLRSSRRSPRPFSRRGPRTIGAPRPWSSWRPSSWDGSSPRRRWP